MKARFTNYMAAEALVRAGAELGATPNKTIALIRSMRSIRLSMKQWAQLESLAVGICISEEKETL